MQATLNLSMSSGRGLSDIRRPASSLVTTALLISCLSIAAQQTVPPGCALTDASVDQTRTGFSIRPWQTSAKQPNSLAWTELQMSGLKGPNLAISEGGRDGWFTNETINFCSASNNPAGNFSTLDGDPDLEFPGEGGVAGADDTDNLSEEILTWVELPAPGTYTMGINTAGGFRVTVGREPRDQFALALDSSEAGYDAADRLFSFTVSKPGIYPMRLLWMNPTGRVGLEWFSVLPDGTKLLLNDRSAPGALRTFPNGPPGPPYVSVLSPGINEQDVAPDAGILIRIIDGATSVDETPVLLLNGQVFNVTVRKSGNTTSIINEWNMSFVQGSTNRLFLAYFDNGMSVFTNGWRFFITNSMLPPSVQSRPVAKLIDWWPAEGDAESVLGSTAAALKAELVLQTGCWGKPSSSTAARGESRFRSRDLKLPPRQLRLGSTRQGCPTIE